MPLNKYADQDEASVCGSCKFRPTKPEAIPDDLIEMAGAAVSLDEVHEVGGQFDYPNGLTPLEWAALRSLGRGRAQAEKLKQQRDKKKKR